MSTVTAPRFDIPVAYAMVGGARVPCTLTREFVRFFEGLLARSGGATGTDSATIESDLADLMSAVHVGTARSSAAASSGDGLSPVAVAGGVEFHVNPLQARAFAQRPAAVAPIDDAQAVISQRSFARR
jgi:hypothetical protein